MTPAGYALPADVVAAVLRYLAGRPYVEVCELIPAVQAARPLKRLSA